MNSPFAQAQSQASPPLWARIAGHWALVVFGVSLLAGAGLAWWRAQLRVDAAYAAAQTEARACAAALQLELGQVSTAAEVLGSLARHGRLGLTNFQGLAREVFNSHPGLVSLELQPAGVVGDIVPRQGNERALGFNVLKDPSQRAGANEAIARRALSLAVPVTLLNGEQGIVARVPLFQRSPEGREVFGGFVAASMRLQDALTRAQIARLPHRGYGFALCLATSSKPKVILAEGLALAEDGAQQQFRANNLDLRLGLKPQGGWLHKGKLALDALGVVLLSILAALLVKILESRQAADGELDEAAERLTREQADRKQSVADCGALSQKLSAAQGELKQAALRLQEAQSRAERLHLQLEAVLREREQALAAQQIEQNKLGVELEGARKTITQLQGRLEAAIQAEQQARSSADQRLEQNQAAVLDLKKQLENATRAARKSAEAGAASLGDLEQKNQKLQARVQALEGVQARVVELEGLLSEAREDLGRREVVSAEPEEASPQTTPEQRPGPAREPKPWARPATQPAVESDARPESTRPALPVAAAKTSEEVLPVSAPTLVSGRTAPEAASSAHSPVPDPGARKKDRKPKRSDNQMDLFGKGESSPGPAVREEAKAATAKEEEPTPARRLPPTPPVDPALLRHATNLIVPLLTDGDPGARDCLKDNRTVFRSVFMPEAYGEFEQLVKDGEYTSALEQLKKAVRKHGL